MNAVQNFFFFFFFFFFKKKKKKKKNTFSDGWGTGPLGGTHGARPAKETTVYIGIGTLILIIIILLLLT